MDKKPRLLKASGFPVWMCERWIGRHKFVAVAPNVTAAYQAAHPVQLPPLPNGWLR